MGLRDFFNSKKSNSGFDPLTDLVLAKLRPGYLVDYAGHTWQVTGYARNDFGEGHLLTRISRNQRFILLLRRRVG